MGFQTVAFIVLSTILFSEQQQQTPFRSFGTIRRSSTHFRRYISSIYNQGQMRSRSRLACVQACFQSNYCQTITFIDQQKLCLLFGEPLDEGILVSNASAETIFLSQRNPRECQSLSSVIVNDINDLSFIALCDPPCQNRGRCIGPNNCSCRSGFVGSVCENCTSLRASVVEDRTIFRFIHFF